jgi:predicted permease
MHALLLPIPVLITALLKIFFVGLIGYVGVRRGIIHVGTLDDLARLTIDIILPCFLFAKLFNEFSIERFEGSYQIALFAAALVGVGLLISAVATSLLRLEPVPRRNVIAMSTFCNAAYLPIPLVVALLPAQQSNLAVLYIALFVFVFSPVQWTVGVWLMKGVQSARSPASPLQFFSPPSVAIALGMLAALPPIKPLLMHVHFVVDAMAMAGEATVPLAMIILGGILATVSIRRVLDARAVLLTILIKLVILPLLTLLFLGFVRYSWLLGLVMLIEAASPPAINLSIIAKRYEGDYAFVSSTVFIAYIVSIFTLSLFLALYICCFSSQAV